MGTAYQAGLRMARINLVINLLLAIGKLTVGVATQSGAMLSDGVHSAADVLSTVVVIVGIRLSAQHADTRHPYGHERMECVAAVVLAIVVGVSGIGIGWSGIQSILTLSEADKTPPGMVALVTALGAIAVKETMFRVTKRVAGRTGSAALMADAWHQRTDALSSLGSFVGVLGANLGLIVLDPLAGVLISALILKAAYDIFADAMHKMTDCACDEGVQQQLYSFIAAQAQVQEVRSLKTRLFGNRVYAEVSIGVDGQLSCREAYETACAVRAAVEQSFESIKECCVHIFPLTNS